MAESYVGKLLVATPALLDPNFARAVVLICDENEDGVMGLILNRPFRVEVATYAPEWGPLASPPPRVFEGGPVHREVGLAIGRLREEAPATGWTPITDVLGLVDLDGSPADLWGDIVGLRVFSVPLRRLVGGAARGRDRGAGRGSWSMPRPPTRSTRSRRTCGNRCCGARAVTSRRSQPARATPSLEMSVS